MAQAMGLEEVLEFFFFFWSERKAVQQIVAPGWFDIPFSGCNDILQVEVAALIFFA